MGELYDDNPAPGQYERDEAGGERQANQIEQRWLRVKHCSADKMWADINTKLLTGEPYRRLRAKIMNCSIDLEPENMPLTPPTGDEPQECVVGTENRPETVSWASVVAREPAARSTRMR